MVILADRRACPQQWATLHARDGLVVRLPRKLFVDRSDDILSDLFALDDADSPHNLPRILPRDCRMERMMRSSVLSGPWMMVFRRARARPCCCRYKASACISRSIVSSSALERNVTCRVRSG